MSNAAQPETNTRTSNASNSTEVEHDERDGSDANPSGGKAIILVGMTGTGKSSFIKLLTGNERVKIGSSLDPETSEIKSYPFFYKHQCVSLVDTPGFDDSRKAMDDDKLLSDISRFLANRNNTVHGFIYFHRIRDVRIGNTAASNIRMFYSLCGAEAMKNVVIATTRWDELQGEQQLQNARNTETELREGHFQNFINNEALLHRHNNTVESAQAVLSYLLRRSPIRKIQLVFEIANGTSLPQTGAGLEVEQLGQLKRHFEGEVKQLSHEFQANAVDNEEEIERLRDKIRELEKMLEKKKSFLRWLFGSKSDKQRAGRKVEVAASTGT